MGCGPQETFRACSDIRISSPRSPVSPSKLSSFSEDTTFDLDRFEDYYDQLFDGQNEDLINQVDVDDYEVVTMKSIKTQKLRLLRKKLLLAKALKKLSTLIALSKEAETEDRDKEREDDQEME